MQCVLFEKYSYLAVCRLNCSRTSRLSGKVFIVFKRRLDGKLATPKNFLSSVDGQRVQLNYQVQTEVHREGSSLYCSVQVRTRNAQSPAIHSTSRFSLLCTNPLYILLYSKQKWLSQTNLAEIICFLSQSFRLWS